MVQAQPSQTAAVVVDELFLSLQGEGLDMGRPQLFLRLGGCPLRCRYCDTPESWQGKPAAAIHHPQGPPRQRPNPWTLAALREEIAALLGAYGLDPERDRLTLALTGGEPLLQAAALPSLLADWGGKVLLETAGILPQALAPLLPAVDLLSLDWKLAASLDRGQHMLAPEACLEAAMAAGVRTQVKVVVDATTSSDELGHALQRMATIAPGVTAILQPVTPVPGGPAAPTAAALVDWSLAFRHLPLDLRVLAQMHPALTLR